MPACFTAPRITRLPCFHSTLSTPHALQLSHSSATGQTALTAAMTDSFTIPLRPVVEKQDRPDTLPVEIAQINSQWGSFREVNEEVLRSKIIEEERDVAPPEEGDQETSDVDTAERLEQLYKRRAEITQFAMSVTLSPADMSWYTRS